jgi:hypothetical protein
MRTTTTTSHEIEGGECPHCGATAKLRRCHICGESAWLIDCGHYSQPRPISADIYGMDVCDDCADCADGEGS